MAVAAASVPLTGAAPLARRLAWVTAARLALLSLLLGLLGLLNATLMAAGMFFQKLNGVKGGGTLLSGWLILSLCCFAPTFPIANKVFLMGGKMSLFVPMGAMTYVLSMASGQFYFGEPVSWVQWLGALLILGGVTVTAWAS